MTFVRVMLFSIFLIACVTILINVLPQMQSNPPEDEEPLVAGDMDMPGMVAWGEKIFGGRGTCTLCHNNLGRAPNILALDLGTVFPERVADARYAGEAKGREGAELIQSYVRESMTFPSAFVVGGFGKKGSNDTVSPMPKVNAAPIQLSDNEINAVIAFMQDRAGFEPTVSLPEAGAAGDVGSDAGVEERKPLTDAEEIVDEYGCGACHDLFDSGGEVGPNLSAAGQRLGRGGLYTAILNPNDTIAEGFDPDIMPQDFGKQMFAGELQLMVDHIMSLSKEGSEP